MLMRRLVGFAIFIASTGTAQEWPQFRGPNVDGIADAPAVFSGPLEVNLEVGWKTSIGSGYAGIAIASGLVATMFEAGEVNVLAAFDPETGAERWRFELGERHPGIDGSYNGPISTPLIVGNLVFGLDPWGHLVAVDRLDGELVWSRRLVEELGAEQPNYGFATSPILMDGKMMVQTGGTNGSVAAFVPETGELVWSVGSDKMDYQSPIPLRVGDRSLLLATGRNELLAIDPASGDRLWHYEHGGGGMIGVQSMVPVPAGDDRLFLAYKAHASAVVDLQRRQGSTVLEQLLESRTMRNSYSVPVYHEGYVYGFSSRFLVCFDPATGEPAWRSRPPGDGFPIIVDKHLVILTKAGSVHVAPATPERYREITNLQVFEELAWTPPTFADGSLFVRSLDAIARVDIRRGARRPATTDEALGDEGRGFARFLKDVREASDKRAVVERFMASQDAFPIVEGDSRVHFVYRGPGEDLAIAGDLIGSRQEKTMAHLEGTDVFYYSAELEPDARVSYRFVRDYEDIVDPLNPLETTTAVYRADMELNRGEAETAMSWLAMPRFEAPAHLREPPSDAPRGRVVVEEVESATYGESHRVHVYLPHGYDDSEDRYPVAYYHGGLGALRRGQLQTSLDNLLGRKVTPLIAVFIERVGEWVPDRYAQMWAEELVPFIDEHYRTVAQKEGRASIGGGDHGFTAAYVMFKQPQIAAKLSSQSIGGLSFRDKKDGVENLVTSPSEQPVEIYMDWGLYDLQSPQEAWDRRAQARVFKEFLVSKGYDVTGGQVHDGSGWASWKNRTDAVLETLFPMEER